jgi:serine/threonine protein phosphatase PrpC
MRPEMSPDLQKQISPEIQETAKLVGRAIEASEDHRDMSEDSGFVTPDLFMGVCDGMGSGPAGEKASGKATEMFLKSHEQMRPEAGVAEWRTAIETTLREANNEIIKIGNLEIFKMGKFLEENPGALVLLERPKAKDVYKAMQEAGWNLPSSAQQEFKKSSLADIEKMRQTIKKNFGIEIETPAATTATVAKMIERPDGDSDLVYGHTGDSRLYVLRLDGTMEQVTQDQGVLQHFVEQGEITKEEAAAIDQCTNLDNLNKLSKDPKRVAFFKTLFANRHGVTSGLGFPDAKFQTGIVRVKAGERAILISDGNGDVQTKEQLAKNAAHGTPAEAAASINAESVRINQESDAREKTKKPRILRSKHDDKTAIVVEAPGAIEEISAEEITEEPEEIGVEEIEVVPIAQLEAEDKKRSAKKIAEIKRAIGM